MYKMSASASGSNHSQFVKIEDDRNRHEERVFSQNGSSTGMTQAPLSLAGSDNVHGMGIAGLPTMDQSTFGSLPPNWADSIPVDMQAQWLQLQQQQQQHHQQIQQQQQHHQQIQQMQMQQQQQQQQSQYNISQGFSHPQDNAGSSISRHTSSSYNNPQDSPEVFVGAQHPFSSPSQSSPFQDASYQHMFQSPSQQQQRTQSPHHSQHSFMSTQNQQAHHPFPQSAQQHLSRNSNDSPLVQDASADLAFLQAATGMQHLPYSTQDMSWQQQQQQQQQQHQQQQFQPSSRNGSITNGNQSHPIMTPDFTDRALSAALASNAQISSNRNITGSGVNVSPMASSNTSSFPQSAGNTTPTILEEDEAIFHAHHHAVGQNDQRFFNAPDHLFTSQSFNQPEPFTGQHPSHMPMPSTLMQPRRAGPNLLRASIYQQYSNINVGMMEERFRDSKEDCLPFIDDVIFNYISAPSRLGLGERTVMIMTSKVAQKSYGAEKRFLCPPPMVLLVGSSWWSACHPVNTTNDEVQPTILTPPRLAISMSGETPNQAGNAGGSSSQQDGVLEWASSSGKLLDTDNPSSEFAISGRSIGRQLFINDSDEKRRHCEALVQIQVPALAASDRKSLGVFPSKPIKVISKPSKKRQSTRNSELGVNHGSTISLFHRLRSQTVSTRYLCVSGAPTWFKGSDGNPFLNTDANTHIPNQGDSPSCFVAKTSSWDPFILYLVDPHMQAGANPTTNSTHNPSVEQKFTPSTAFMQSGIPGDGNDSSSSANMSSGMSSTGPGSSGINTQGRPAHYPIPPVNALPFSQGNTPIHYNQPIVLQCLNTAVVSPVMVIRKADRGTTVVGGGQPMMSFGSNGPPPGEMYGEPVSQLHKVAFEILEEQPDGGESIQAGNPGISGHFLGCLNEDVGLRKPLGPRQWMQTSSASTTVNQSGMHINPLLRDTGVVGNMSNPTTPTTPLTPMTTQMFGSAGNHSGMNAGNISGEFKMDPSISPTSFMMYGSGNSGSQQMMGSSSQHGMSGSSIPPTTYPYNMNPQMMPTAATDDQADDGKVKRPRRVSSSVLVPQKSGGSSVAVSNANKNRRRGQSLSVIGLQNQLNAQQQQQQQRNQMQASSQQTPPHHMPHSMHQQRPSFTASTTNTSSSSSSISSMTGIPSGHSLRRTSSFAQSDTSSLSAAAINSVASNPNTTTNHWTVDVHDSDVWTIVGVDIARHTFYLPPKLVNGTRPKADGVDASIAHLVTMPAPAHPITPIPILHKCSGGASGLSASLSNSSLALAASHKSGNGMYQAEANLTGTPDSPLRPASASSSGGGGGGGRGTASGYVTLIGENFTPNLFIFFGDWRSTHVSVPNSNTIICAAPPPLDEFGFARDHVPIILVRRDGVIFPTDCIWYKTTT